MSAAPPTPEQIAALKANDHDDVRTNFIIGNTVCLFVAFLSVVLRFWSRRLVKASYGLDDWMIVLGLLTTAIYDILLFVTTNYGMGRHIWWLSDPAAFIKLSTAAEVFYNAAIPLIKTSILLFYRRIFPQQGIIRALWILGVFIFSYSLAQILVDIFQCTPVESLWLAAPKKHCVNVPLLIKICGIINILTDVAILALPMPSLWKLNLSTARKRMLIILFLIGGIACVGSIVRLFYVNKIGNSQDVTWDYAYPALIANVELCIGVLAANLPTYRPIILKMVSSTPVTDTRRTSQLGGSGPVKDSLQIPLTSLFFSRNSTFHELGDDETLTGNDGMVHTYVTKDERKWPGSQTNKIRVTTEFNTSQH